MTPSETSLNEPTTQKATGVRSSFKRAPNDQPSQTQEPAGYNFSSMPTFVGKDNFMNQKQGRHAYIDQFLNMLHPYIEEVRDVRADGNCGFRAVAVGLKLHENEWTTIRYDLMEELRIYYDQYIIMFDAKECDDVKKRLNFFENGFAPIDKWMNMPEIGFLIASRYNVIFHNITTLGSMTYLPLRSIPPPWYDHKFITLRYVNSSHYVNVLLQGDYPVPTIASQWFRYRSECAVA
ncbi:FAR-RED impaired response 1-like protein [Tanacetum coccineum]|uniref:FAR-RED impaired response 1-like protein n=1 Tax=Tanacetum coccineum TaxID=301880 RepID=A0ABQ5ENA9_9ASTR